MSMKRRMEELAVSETGFVFDPFSGSTFTVNATGLCVLGALKDGLAGPAVAARLEERFDARGADLARDVEDFMSALRQHGILGAEEGQ